MYPSRERPDGADFDTSGFGRDGQLDLHRSADADVVRLSFDALALRPNTARGSTVDRARIFDTAQI